MSQRSRQPPPLILIIAGHDPSGAAGIQADVETATACGCRAGSLITATTAQNTTRFEAMRMQPPDDLRRQAQVLLEDMAFQACKVGLLGSAGMAECVADILEQIPGVPVVLDPVTHTGTGIRVADAALMAAIRERLLEHTTVLTPNATEVLELGQAAGIDEAAANLLRGGAGCVLVTGTDDDTPSVIHRLYGGDPVPEQFEYERLPQHYHGSGCTLSAAIASMLARGMEVPAAVRSGLEFTWRALNGGYRYGKGQWHPDRPSGTSGS